MRLRSKRAFVAAYLLLLAASHGVRRLGTEPPPVPTPEVLTVEAPRFTATGTVAGAPVRLRYRLWEPAQDPERAPWLLCLHGSPGSSRDFLRLAPELATRYRVVAPDLPGFGASERDVPDYSVAAHARYARALLDQLGAERAHVLGFSMGGGVALELIHQEPARAASLTLLSAIGVQELELLGNHTVNHAVHGFQLGALWLLEEAAPHFGLLDGGMLSIPYARNFYDSDQRPLRGILERWEGPTLVLHGDGDVLVPYAAALEHHRIVPQSELVTYPGENHFLVFGGGERLSAPLLDFFGRVDAGQAPGRAQATPERLAAAARELDPRELPPVVGLAKLVLMAILALSTLISEDLACIAGGVLAGQGRIGFWAATFACLLGIFVGDLLLFLAGRWLGRPWLTRRPVSWFVSEAAVERSSRWFAEKGPAIIFTSRFVPGTRLPTYFTAGLLRTPLWRFVGWFLLAAAAWTPVLVGVSSLVGRKAYDYFDTATHYLPWLVALVLALYVLVRVLIKALTWKGRRQLAGWWGRKRRWEFWPPWAFYPPVVLYVAWLALRYRSLTLFTAANPGMPASGFIGESKGDILDRLDGRWVARYRRLPAALSPAERAGEVRRFVEEHGLEPKVVLKPDQGQRGAGVHIVAGWQDIEATVARLEGDWLVQEHIGGSEYGVFYVRLPGEKRGRVFAITEKRLPAVVGDGRRTLEELMLADERAIFAEGAYRVKLGDRLDTVPAAGEPVLLTDLGTHCRGAIFLDGGHHKTADLEAVIHEVSSSFAGFYFGRYDLKAPSLEDFRAGRALRVLELNGVTSEATSIYDPKNSLWHAYRVLFEQWRLAFEIGHRNRQRGEPVTSVGELLRLLTSYQPKD
jgi:pimeloyl-ACP methyl ester carboxylesterase/membrane protein DedA with SNARE-associated domain